MDPPSHDSTSQLLGLPTELRFRVYNALFETYGFKWDGYLGAFLTNRPLHAEMKDEWLSFLRKKLVAIQATLSEKHAQAPDQYPAATIQIPMTAQEGREQVKVTITTTATQLEYFYFNPNHEPDWIYDYSWALEIHWALLQLHVRRLFVELEVPIPFMASKRLCEDFPRLTALALNDNTDETIQEWDTREWTVNVGGVCVKDGWGTHKWERMFSEEHGSWYSHEEDFGWSGAVTPP